MPNEMSVRPIEEHSSKSWKEWVKKLDSMDARNLKHKDIAILTRQLMEMVGGIKRNNQNLTGGHKV